MSRTRWLALAGVGALAVMALLIPGGAGASFDNGSKYEGVVNGSQASTNVAVYGPPNGSCTLAANQKAWVVQPTTGSHPSSSKATSITITLRDGNDATVSSGSVTTYSTDSGATNSVTFTGTAPCSGSGSVLFHPVGGGTDDTVNVTFNNTYPVR